MREREGARLIGQRLRGTSALAANAIGCRTFSSPPDSRLVDTRARRRIDLAAAAVGALSCLAFELLEYVFH